MKEMRSETVGSERQKKTKCHNLMMPQPREKYLRHDSTTFVGIHTLRIANCEGEGTWNFYFHRLTSVQLIHAYMLSDQNIGFGSIILH